MAEQTAHNRLVPGSNPGGPTSFSFVVRTIAWSLDFVVAANAKVVSRRIGPKCVSEFICTRC